MAYVNDTPGEAISRATARAKQQRDSMRAIRELAAKVAANSDTEAVAGPGGAPAPPTGTVGR